MAKRLDMTTRLGDGRIDNTWRDCPKCPPQESYYGRWSYRPRMHIPMEGRTDIVKCWKCGHVEPRFSEKRPLQAEQYNYLTEQWEPEKID